MRPLKFRVWNKKTNTYVEGHGRHDNPSLDGVNLFGETILLGAFMNGVSLEELNDCVALQYTGLEDKNGKEIFEGDILQLHGDMDRSKWSVVFQNGMFTNGGGVPIFNQIYENYGNDNEKNICEVIGNIFENPELLK